MLIRRGMVRACPGVCLPYLCLYGGGRLPILLRFGSTSHIPLFTTMGMGMGMGNDEY
jgi:hypothetical protein